MDKAFFDLDAGSGDPSEKINLAKSLGWAGVCLVKEFDSGFGAYAKEAVSSGKDSNLRVLVGALINPKSPDEVQKKARLALESADLVFVFGGDEEINRAAAECWEVDVLCHPERVDGRDSMDQRNSGLDDASVRFMAERGIAIELNFASLLNSYGHGRAQILGRMRQNMMLAKKYGAPMIMTSGADDAFGLRTPRDFLSLCLSIGGDAEHAKKIIELWPGLLVKKTMDRRNPDILLKGLEVESWDASADACKKTDRKRMYGWY